MREDLLQSAVSFLSSAQVQTAAKEKKVQFLKNKGLNDQEIEEAFKRVGTTTANDDTNQVQSGPRLPPRPTAMYQPIQVVYYPPAPIPRMTTKQLLSYALIIGISTFGITALLTTIIKKFMSRVLKKITDYQRDRYQQQTKLLSRMESTIKSFRIDDPELGCEQVKLNLSLDQLIKSMDTVKERTQPHKKLRSDVERLRHALLQSLTTRGTNGRAPAKFGSYREYVFDGTVQSIKSEIRSVKGMLLSRHNFPIVTTSSTFAASNIPPAPTVPATNAYHPRRRNRINDFSTKLEDLC